MTDEPVPDAPTQPGSNPAEAGEGVKKARPKTRWISRPVPGGVHLLISGGMLAFSITMMVCGKWMHYRVYEVVCFRILPVLLLLEILLVVGSLSHHLLKKGYLQVLLTFLALVLLLLIPVAFYVSLMFVFA